MTGAVVGRLARNPVVVAWLPVVVLPPVLVLDGALASGGPAVTVFGLLAAIIGCLPLVLRRRLPFVALALPLTAGIVLVLWQLEPGTTVVLIPMVALVEIAQRGTRRRTLWTACAVMPCVAVAVLPFADDSAEFASILIRNLALCWLALAAGDIVRHERTERARLLREREEESRQRVGAERLRIARDVHDVVAHAMVAINVQAGVAAHRLDRDPGQARAALRDIKQTSGEALADLRATLGVLRDHDGTAPVRPVGGLDDLDDLAGGLRAAGVHVTLAVEPLVAVPALVHATSYRIVQEALTNVLRHASATTVSVQVRRDAGALYIEVADDGSGTSADADATGSGNGVRGMRERAAAIGGTLDSGPGDGGGWQVRARLPIAGVGPGAPR